MERLVGELEALERLRERRGRPPPGATRRPARSLEETVARFAPGGDRGRGRARRGSAGPSRTATLSFVADRLAVERILGNLVANALAAVPAPGGHVWLAARPVPAVGSAVAPASP